MNFDGDDRDVLVRLVEPVALDVLDGLANFHAVGDAAEDGVLVVEPGRGHGGDEELGPVGVGSRVGHGHRKGAVVPEAWVEFVVELAAPDAFAAGAVAQRIARLDHEGFDDLCARRPVELGGAQEERRESRFAHG